MNIIHTLENLNIRNKLLFMYSMIIFLAIILSGVLIYSNMKKTIETNIESELQNSTNTILNMVRTSAAVSLKNYLRAIAEKNREIVAYFHDRFAQGLMSEDAARQKAGEILLRQSIGKSGYIYCINSKGVLVVHPRGPLQGVNISRHAFAREQKARKQGYLEYDWRNPGETSERPKALYMVYFKPWDWIISVSAYREEFHELVNVDDFRESVLSLRFGETGYSYVIDLKGNLIIHPKLEQRNIYDSQDANGRFFIREICETRSGKIIYPWKNPGEAVHREKLVIFNYIPEFNWIVASSSYLEEFYSPLRSMRKITFAAIFSSLFLMLPLVIRISSSITTPLEELMKRFETGAQGNFSVRMTSRSDDEVGRLAAYFNSFMERLEQYSKSLQEEIHDRRQAEQRLKLSEEMFHKAFSSSPNAILITSLADMRFINVNDGFLTLTGYARSEVIDRTFWDIRLLPDPESARSLFDMLRKHGRIRNYEIECLTRSGETRTGVMSAEIIELWDEQCMLSNIADITDNKRLEKEIMDSTEKERKRIGQDLHDDLCPHLIGIEALAKVLNRKLENQSEQEALLAGKIRSLIRDAIDKTRNLTRGLLPVYLVDHGIESSIQELARQAREVYGVSCRFSSRGAVALNDNTAATHLFYIVQEALHNAVKHANAKEIRIDLVAESGKIALNISDDGVGLPDLTDSKGMGMHIMGFRAKKINASLDIRQNGDRGTVVSIELRKNSGEGTNG